MIGYTSLPRVRTLLAVAFFFAAIACSDDTTESIPCAKCDDGLPCTIDSCAPDGSCDWQVKPGNCFIAGRCVTEGEISDAAPCMVCQPGVTTTGWTSLPDGALCQDGNACVEESRCKDDRCELTSLDCNDDNPCTDDACDPSAGCQNIPSVGGVLCDDGDVCTQADICANGACLGEAVICDDDNPCTDDLCDDTGSCSFTEHTEACDDGDACTAGDACSEGVCNAGDPKSCDDGNPCTIDVCDSLAGCYALPDAGASCDDGDACSVKDVCAAGVCKGTPRVCDDGSVCTTDSCEPELGCVTAIAEGPCCADGVSLCDDGNPCTTDDCEGPDTPCEHAFNNAECDDGTGCTTGGSCADGECLAVPLDCDDGNPCTDDSCETGQGCTSVALDEVPCDDGLACSTDDQCEDGVCVADKSECGACSEGLGDDAVKVTEAGFADDDTVGFDLDGDGEVDNALAALAGMVNTQFAESIAEGSVMLLVEFRGLGTNPFEVALYQGELAPESAECDFQSASCAYLVDSASVEVDGLTCSPAVSMSATADGDTITAGGPGTSVPFSFPVGDGVISVTIINVTLSATAISEAGGNVVTLDGMLGGAILASDLKTALEGLPEDALGGAVTPEQAAGLIDLLTDIDTDGDGVPDAVSLALTMSAIDATIVGVKESE